MGCQGSERAFGARYRRSRPLGPEEVEVAVEHCGVCHSDLSVLNNEWGISEYPAILGHEVVGRVTAMGPNAKGLKVQQRVGVGWDSRKLHALSSVHVGTASSLPGSATDHHRSSRQLRDAHPRAL